MIYLKHLFDYQGNPREQRKSGKPNRETNNVDHLHGFENNITIPSHITWILGTKNIRKIYNQLDETKPLGQLKWEIELEENNLDWRFLYCVTTNCKMNARSKNFQFQILHRSLVTNKNLHQFNIRDNELCDNCNSIVTISHLLYDCTGY